MRSTLRVVFWRSPAISRSGAHLPLALRRLGAQLPQHSRGCSAAPPALAPQPFLRSAPLPCARPLRYSKLSGAIPVSSSVALQRSPLSGGPTLGTLQGPSTSLALGPYGTRSIQGSAVLSSVAPVFGHSGAHIGPLPAIGRPGAQPSQCSTHVSHMSSPSFTLARAPPLWSQMSDPLVS